MSTMHEMIVWARLAARSPELCRWSASAVLSSTARAPVEVASLLCSPFAPLMLAGDARAFAAASATVASAGVPTMLEGICLATREVVDALDVLVWDGHGWVPAGTEGPGLQGEPVHRHQPRIDS